MRRPTTEQIMRDRYFILIDWDKVAVDEEPSMLFHTSACHRI